MTGSHVRRESFGPMTPAICCLRESSSTRRRRCTRTLVQSSSWDPSRDDARTGVDCILDCILQKPKKVGWERSALNYMNNVLLHHRALYRQARPRTFTRSRVLRLAGKKLAHRFIASVLLIGHRPLRPPRVHLTSFT